METKGDRTKEGGKQFEKKKKFRRIFGKDFFFRLKEKIMTGEKRERERGKEERKRGKMHLWMKTRISKPIWLFILFIFLRFIFPWWYVIFILFIVLSWLIYNILVFHKPIILLVWIVNRFIIILFFLQNWRTLWTVATFLRFLRVLLMRFSLYKQFFVI